MMTNSNPRSPSTPASSGELPLRRWCAVSVRGPVLSLGLAIFVLIPAPHRAVAQIPPPTDAPKPLSPEESASAFKLPEGFRMEVIASEPLIESPSGACWDEHGSLFVSELHGYNLEGQLDIEELNKTGKLDTEVRRVQADEKFKVAARGGTFGRVKKLRDTNGDGRMDTAESWGRDLPPVYGLVAARGGVILACAPHIIFLADRDGDGKAEVQETLFTGFPTGNLERGINAPQWGTDGWIYFGQGAGGGEITGPHLSGPVNLPRTNFRIRPDGSAIEPVTGGTGTFGFALTETDALFTVSTGEPGRCVAPLPWRYLIRNPDAAARDLEVATGEKRVFPLASAHPWRQKRAEHAEYNKFYRDRYGAGDSDAGGLFTSACCPLIYQDAVLPGVQGQYFVCEPSGNILHRALIEPDGSALKLVRPPGEKQSEFAASSDSWSHPMNLTHGPDGSIWVVDYYREIIEDYSAIPRHLQQQYGLYNGHDRGRLYRLTHRDAAAAPPADMSKLDAAALAKECASPLFWRRQTAQRLLVERSDQSIAPALRLLLAAPQAAPATLITTLRTMDQVGVIGPADLMPFLSHGTTSVRTHALQLSDRWLAREEGRELLDKLLSALAQERDPRVLIQFALSLGESRDPRATAALAEIARTHLEVRWMQSAILSSLSGRGADMLAELLREPGGSGSLVPGLAEAVAAGQDEAELARTLGLIAAAEPDTQITALEAMVAGRKNAPRKPLDSPEARTALATLAASPSAAVRTATGSLADTFVPSAADAPAALPEFVKPAMEVSEESFRTFLAALSGPRDLKRGHEVFTQTCASCHRVGEEGVEFGAELLAQIGIAEEALLKEILMPSERIRPGYETTMLEMKNGQPLIGLLKDDGATSITLSQPGGAQQTVLRKDVTGVRRLPMSLMPSFAALPPADVASVLAWLRSQAGPEAGLAVLFDEEPDFSKLLTQESGRATIQSTGAAVGKLCLHITPPQRASPQIPGWNYRIVETPGAPDEFRYLRLSWRTSGHGVMLELARSGQWPKAEDANGRYFAGRNTTGWQARETSPEAPGEWDTVTVDLWKDMGAFTMTGIAPTAMGGDAWFDRIELLRDR